MDYAVQLTRAPWEVKKENLEHLKSLEITEREISDTAQVVGYFNYINRIAEGLGVGK